MAFRLFILTNLVGDFVDAYRKENESNDEIEVINQCDYEVFWQKCPLRHIRVASVVEKVPLTEEVNSNNESKSSGDKTSSENATDPNCGTYGAVHQSVTCDGCLKCPIVGFRYKCLQCRNYDLCEGCEAKHKHPEHLMIRIQTWPFGNFKDGKRHHKSFSFANECPFVFSTAKTFDSSAKTTMGHGTDKEQHKHHGSNRSRKSHRHHMPHGIFTNLYNMMQDLAEGGGPTMSDHENSSSSTENGPKENAPGSGANAGGSSHDNAHNYGDFHSTVHAAASKAASAAAEKAAKSAAAAAKAAVEATIFGFTEQSDPTKSKGATPKHYKNANIWTTPPFEKTNNCSERKTPESAQETGGGVGSQQASPNNDDFNSNEESTKSHPFVAPPIIKSAENFSDPIYVKAGIQIFNNFSEIFAKMLGPETNNNTTDTTTPGPHQTETPLQQSRRNSTSSKISSSNENVPTSAAATAADTTSDINENSSKDKESAAAATAEQAKKMNEKDLTETPKPSSPEKHAERSGSEETDWQFVDNNSVLINGNDVDVNASVEASTSDNTEPPVVLNYVLLDNSTNATTPSPSAPTETVPVATNTDHGTGTAGNSNSIGATIPGPAIPLPDVQRVPFVYHWDRPVNDAVNVMMAMGFSNEGDWLTKLLESVNGNISEALDVIHISQHST